ncbi:MAG: hypothetical protein JWR80_6702 [Bradyrhizobium sp.]|nr:hypothetical protein [Bradyrhizobium sp.]
MRKIIACAAVLMLGVTQGMTASAQTAPVEAHIWVKAFIPKEHDTNPGYIRPVPGQPDKFMIPGPGIPWTTGPLPWVGSCYNTNNRGFSSSPDAEAKLTTGARLKTNGITIADFVPETPPSANTQQYDCTTGAVTCDKAPDISGLAVDAPVAIAGRVRVRLRGSGLNPCISIPAFMTPTIKYDLTVDLDSATGYATISGTLAQFPAYEAYATIGPWPTVSLMTEAPASGATAWSLLFNRPVDKTVRYAALDGVWKSTDPGARFTLTVVGDQVQWSERAASGQTLVRAATLTRQPGKGYRLERTNDGPVLTFLGFSSAIQTSIQAIGAQPSFLELRLDGESFAANWNGVLVIKDNQGKFKELKQPGATPPKPYIFKKQ